MARISKKEDPTHDCAGRTDAGPDSVSCANGDCLHRLRDRKKAQHDKDDGDDARKKTCKALTKLQGNREADLEKTS